MVFETVDFNLANLLDGVSAVMESRAQQKGLVLETAIDPAVAQDVSGDFGRLQQVLYNLVGNAIKFTETGTVRVHVDEINRTPKGVELRFEISDSGIGIAEDAIDQIFEKFSQADTSTTRLYGGTGLGLTICRQLVEAMGGKIGVDSTLGQGSTFWFTTSLKIGTERSSVDREGDTGDKIPGVGRPLRILVAEDNAVNQEVIAMTLENDGHTVACVENGAEAIQAVQASTYDLVLMDIQMPEMDGIAAVKQIRALPAPVGSIPVVALTANAMVGDRESYIEAGMDDHAAKPIVPAELFETIRRLLPSD